MADTPSQPPGWPGNEQPPQPPTPPTGFEPPVHPAPPIDQSSFEPPSYQPPPQPAPGRVPPAQPPSYQPPQLPPPGRVPPTQPAPHPGWIPPAPDWGGPPPPPPSDRRGILTTVVVIIGVLLLGIGSCTVWFVSTVKAPVDEANRFMAEIDHGDYRAAVALTDSSCNGGMTASDLNEIFGNGDISYDLNSSSITNNRATVSGSLSSSSVNFNRVEVRLSDLSGDWRVCSVRTS